MVTISLLIIGILGMLAGTTLYGFGRLMKEVGPLRAREDTPEQSSYGRRIQIARQFRINPKTELLSPPYWRNIGHCAFTDLD